MTEFLIALTAGLGVGSVYAMVALGFGFIYRTTGGFNFAQGQLVTLGSLFAYTLWVQEGLPAFVVVIVTCVIVSFVGLAIERIAVWPLARRGEESTRWLISTLAVSVLLTGGAERIWGTMPLGVPNLIGPDVLHLPDHAFVPTAYVTTTTVAVLITLALAAFQRFTFSGRLMRALANNRSAVELAGVSVLGLGAMAYMIGGVISGLAGIMIAPVTYADSTAGFNLVILGFAGIAIGGFASHWGALLGGLLVGVIENFTALYIGLNYQDIMVLLVLIVVLLVRPEGLIMSRAVRDV